MTTACFVQITHCSSLAAYGFDPAASINKETYEDGLVEEEEVEDEEEEDSDEDEDDVKLVFTGAGTRLDNR
jgi:NACalpha-BTF3-like transcription factor